MRSGVRSLGFARQELRCLDFVRARMRALNSKKKMQRVGLGSRFRVQVRLLRQVKPQVGCCDLQLSGGGGGGGGVGNKGLYGNFPK